MAGKKWGALTRNKQSIELLERDVELKKATVKRYAAKLDEWSKQLPVLEAACRETAKHRTDGRDFSYPVIHSTRRSDNNDEEEDAEFVEV